MLWLTWIDELSAQFAFNPLIFKEIDQIEDFELVVANWNNEAAPPLRGGWQIIEHG